MLGALFSGQNRYSCPALKSNFRAVAKACAHVGKRHVRTVMYSSTCMAESLLRIHIITVLRKYGRFLLVVERTIRNSVDMSTLSMMRATSWLRHQLHAVWQLLN